MVASHRPGTYAANMRTNVLQFIKIASRGYRQKLRLKCRDQLFRQIFRNSF